MQQMPPWPSRWQRIKAFVTFAFPQEDSQFHYRRESQKAASLATTSLKAWQNSVPMELGAGQAAPLGFCWRHCRRPPQSWHIAAASLCPLEKPRQRPCGPSEGFSRRGFARHLVRSRLSASRFMIRANQFRSTLAMAFFEFFTRATRTRVIATHFGGVTTYG